MGVSRRHYLAAAAFALVAACAPQGGGGGEGGAYARPGDMAIGAADAPVTLIEYASVTCPHCKVYHDTVFPEIRRDYVDTGKVRYIFREFPTAYPEVAAAAFLVARCGDVTTERYFERLDVFFDQQEQIALAVERGQARQALLNVARSAGLSEAQFETCVRDENGYKRIQETVKHASETYDVAGTPSLILNGERLTAPEHYGVAGLRALLDEKLAGA